MTEKSAGSALLAEWVDNLNLMHPQIRSRWRHFLLFLCSAQATKPCFAQGQTTVIEALLRRRNCWLKTNINPVLRGESPWPIFDVLSGTFIFAESSQLPSSKSALHHTPLLPK